MKTATDNITLAKLCEQSNIPASLIRAVVRQMGGWESFKESAPDICRGGIDGGLHGFIYNADTEPFARRNRHLISDMAEKQVQELGGDNIFEMIQGFGCFRHGEKPSVSDIGSALFVGKDRPDGVPVLNALAWYAGEEVSREYCRMIGED